MSSRTRKDLIAACKERKTVAGVFAVICTATGETWVGQSRHIDTQRNGLWFTLKHGRFPYGPCRRPGTNMARRSSASSNWTACLKTSRRWRGTRN